MLDINSIKARFSELKTSIEFKAFVYDLIAAKEFIENAIIEANQAVGKAVKEESEAKVITPKEETDNVPTAAS